MDLDVTAMAVLNDTMDINLLGGFMPTLGDSFWLIDAGSYSGTPLFDFDDAMLASGFEWNTSTFMTNGTIFVAEAAAVPEPGSLSILLLTCCGLGFQRRRKPADVQQNMGRNPAHSD